MKWRIQIVFRGYDFTEDHKILSHKFEDGKLVLANVGPIYRWNRSMSVGNGPVLGDQGSLHIRDWELVTITLQALSLVEKAEPVQVCSTLRLRDQRSIRMQDGCKVYMDSYMASNGSCFYGHLDIFQKPSLGGRLDIESADNGTLNAHKCWVILFHHVCRFAWIKIHWNSI